MEVMIVCNKQTGRGLGVFLALLYISLVISHSGLQVVHKLTPSSPLSECLTTYLQFDCKQSKTGAREGLGTGLHRSSKKGLAILNTIDVNKM